jgi:hypothetical protein
VFHSVRTTISFVHVRGQTWALGNLAFKQGHLGFCILQLFTRTFDIHRSSSIVLRFCRFGKINTAASTFLRRTIFLIFFPLFQRLHFSPHSTYSFLSSYRPGDSLKQGEDETSDRWLQTTARTSSRTHTV